MSLTRRGFLRNLGSLVGALSVGLTVTLPQRKKKVVFKTYPAPNGDYLVGYKGSQFFETGYVLAPYIPLYKTPDIIVTDEARRFAHSYAKKCPNMAYYAKASLTRPKNLLQLS